ncbi:putative transmembrane protein [Gregarina niphandrodes]|uniref:Transmembrane protein n=1 Tax=Gregarina niphandrodes TaxID=110365 RepID=A0A023AZQ0_GRENI|nr:putative transmembrane protein [Gregarina niphandrodes]EZG44362.1 putative transmembrane protein [Gregarina niphandrodes]|eukprot:XP_011132677.1 putative transmembrane protein [Gregarina niphandrodes]
MAGWSVDNLVVWCIVRCMTCIGSLIRWLFTWLFDCLFPASLFRNSNQKKEEDACLLGSEHSETRSERSGMGNILSGAKWIQPRHTQPRTTEPHSGAEPCGAEPCGTEPCGAEPCGTEPCGTEPCGAQHTELSAGPELTIAAVLGTEGNTKTESTMATEGNCGPPLSLPWNLLDDAGPEGYPEGSPTNDEVAIALEKSFLEEGWPGSIQKEGWPVSIQEEGWSGSIQKEEWPESAQEEGWPSSAQEEGWSESAQKEGWPGSIQKHGWSGSIQKHGWSEAKQSAAHAGAECCVSVGDEWNVQSTRWFNSRRDIFDFLSGHFMAKKRNEEKSAAQTEDYRGTGV